MLLIKLFSLLLLIPWTIAKAQLPSSINRTVWNQLPPITNDGCTPEQYANISLAIQGAISLAGAIDYTKDYNNDPAAIEYFGPPEIYNGSYSNVLDILAQVTTHPWQILASCSFSTTSRNASAYNALCTLRNVKRELYQILPSQTGAYQADENSAQLLFCDDFFDAPTLDELVIMAKSTIYEVDVLSVDAFSPNRDTMVLRGLLHFPGLSSTIVTTPLLDVWAIIHLWWSTPFEWVFPGYDAIISKVLARAIITPNVTIVAARNAYNYAYFALAKYVQLQFGSYPWLPTTSRQNLPDSSLFQDPYDLIVPIDGSHWMINYTTWSTTRISKYSGYLFGGCSDSSCFDAESAIKTNILMNLTDSVWLQDFDYPTRYLQDQKGFIEETQSYTQTHWQCVTDLRKNETQYQDCVEFNGDVALSMIQDFCSNSSFESNGVVPYISLGDGISFDNNVKTAGFSWNYSLGGTLNDTSNLYLVVEIDQDRCRHAVPIQSKFDIYGALDGALAIACNDTFLRVINSSCDTNHWPEHKLGGTMSAGCMKFTVLATPTSKPYSIQKPDLGTVTCNDTAGSSDKCTCWYTGLPNVVDDFCKPQAGCSSPNEDMLRYDAYEMSRLGHPCSVG